MAWSWGTHSHVCVVLPKSVNTFPLNNIGFIPYFAHSCGRRARSPLEIGNAGVICVRNRSAQPAHANRATKENKYFIAHAPSEMGSSI